ncbi:MurR/RpiR family transcriptional regulator [Roseomonas marmotae]|uniref:MurR/RpiR family transcriptional regulator n=1 Tax=Roseomonas marmotae TaxID=2768161 RepID=A0ABS3KBR6_9PROT|nr:MurR/RpiR family transcriptional regulator [Roseomonas marmotae]MBO1073791.1 MurR/RpiR family transcriptional regulator [Roseomonas marmotae]QTI78579.1 MurR/RpiR family transcriptional regulator [Roseomonas marmotae]
MTPPSPLDLLRRALPDLPPRLQEVARYIARHDFDAATRSMRELAAAAGAQPASFTRLAQALGYAGWDALRDALIEAHRQARLATGGPFSKRIRQGRPATPDPAAAMAGDMLAADAAGLTRLDGERIGHAAEALHLAPSIWVVGFRSCRAVANLLHYQLSLFRPHAVRLVGGDRPEDLDLGAFQPKDVVLLVTFAPYSRTSLQAARAAREAGCVIVAIADCGDAPTCEGADHFLPFEAAAAPGFFPSLTGALATAQALVAASFLLGGDAALARLHEAEDRLAALSQYLPNEDSQA